jgi:tRNA threonylcarbamoyladenosine biosynthesis protein TsaB
VRVALSVTKGMAAALSIPVWGVSSLDALVLAAGPCLLPVCAVIAAGRGRYASGLYVGGRESQPPRLATLGELIDLIVEPTLVVGELTADDRTSLEQHGCARVAPKAASLRRAGFLAELGWRIAQAGDPGDPTVLDAIYLS